MKYPDSNVRGGGKLHSKRGSHEACRSRQVVRVAMQTGSRRQVSPFTLHASAHSSSLDPAPLSRKAVCGWTEIAGSSTACELTACWACEWKRDGFRLDLSTTNSRLLTDWTTVRTPHSHQPVTPRSLCDWVGSTGCSVTANQQRQCQTWVQCTPQFSAFLCLEMVSNSRIVDPL